MVEGDTCQVNKFGLAHLAFEVDDVEETLKALLEEGGSQFGEVVRAKYADGKEAIFVYAADCEGNIVELQSWMKDLFS